MIDNFRRFGFVPDLLRNHKAVVCETENSVKASFRSKIKISIRFSRRTWPTVRAHSAFVYDSRIFLMPGQFILATLPGQQRPQVAFAAVFSVPIPSAAVVFLAVAVVVVAVKRWAVRRVNFQYLINDLYRLFDQRIVGRFNTEPH